MTGAGFAAASGDGPPPPDDPEGRRAAEVRVAFEGLLQIRRLSNTGSGDPRARPARWERNRPERAVALALEAAGTAPSAVDATGARTATGYRVGPGERPGAVRVEWLGPPGSGAVAEEEARLTECARTLERLGWEALLYRGPRKRRFLEVEPMPGPE
ncbi:hypothetical protein NX801_17915 [Streptomyces sp. LP05-1]|uniref:Uncharacterized protein n=1 Tax=Streptomyces pyxinae TaxID=2970734 RepID=A0ABT2CJB0_9ACTN|nr:hypothetical protein [Streptomyces sp. LP05-1]MCS0637508.1 hypothetical protein [Streptomyces sp. LP05-1]